MDKVIFRKWKPRPEFDEEGGDIIALLPDTEVNYGNIESYQHIGQHGEASVGIIRDTIPARPHEYADLLAELRSIGYEPKIYQRLQYRWLNWQRR